MSMEQKPDQHQANAAVEKRETVAGLDKKAAQEAIKKLENVQASIHGLSRDDSGFKKLNNLLAYGNNDGTPMSSEQIAEEKWFIESLAQEAKEALDALNTLQSEREKNEKALATLKDNL